MVRKRTKYASTKILSEAEELKFLNRKIQENKVKHADAMVLKNYRRMFAAACQSARENAIADQSMRYQRKKRNRAHRHQMRALANRVFLCVAVMFGVCLSWWFDLVRPEFLWGVLFLCSLSIAFTCGKGEEKAKQFKRE